MKIFNSSLLPRIEKRGFQTASENVPGSKPPSERQQDFVQKLFRPTSRRTRSRPSFLHTYIHTDRQCWCCHCYRRTPSPKCTALAPWHPHVALITIQSDQVTVAPFSLTKRSHLCPVSSNLHGNEGLSFLICSKSAKPRTKTTQCCTYLCAGELW